MIGLRALIKIRYVVLLLLGCQTSETQEDNFTLGPLYMWCSWSFRLFHVGVTAQ